MIWLSFIWISTNQVVFENFKRFFNWYGCLIFEFQPIKFVFENFKRFFNWYGCLIFEFQPIKLSLKTLRDFSIDMVLKLSLKDQILINFTKSNSYFSYVSDHCLWAWFLCLEIWWLCSSMDLLLVNLHLLDIWINQCWSN